MPNPSSIPVARMPPKASRAEPGTLCRAIIKSNTTTASRAPMGSMTMPSQRRIPAMLRVGRTVRRIGMITVGPVTTMMAPNSRAKSSCRSNNAMAASAISHQVATAPTVTRLRTTCPKPRMSLKRRVRLPSKRMIATAIETSGNNRTPNRASGSSRPVIGPSSRPHDNRNRMAGSRSFHASH